MSQEAAAPSNPPVSEAAESLPAQFPGPEPSQAFLQEQEPQA